MTPINISLFCRKCERREAHKPIWFAHATPAPGSGIESSKLSPDLQLIFIVYQCQICHGDPDGVLIRKEGWHLSLDGRSPIEHIEVPAYIPKPERQWFRDAVIGVHAGKTLAALFYLRTFIEQFARRQTGLTGRQTGDEIMSAYNEILPERERGFMPSLREWYERLSQAIHGAKT